MSLECVLHLVGHQRINIAKILRVLLLLSLFITAQAAPSAAYATGTIRHVTPTGLNSGTCGTWATACNLQRALAVVAVSGDQVWVKQGTYKPTSTTNRSASFLLKNGVSVYGGFGGSETLLSQRNPKTHVTILSGNIGATGDASDNSYHVVTASGVNATAVLDGFTITAGNANKTSAPDDEGGSVYVHLSNVTLTNLTISGNSAFYSGGAIVNISSSPLLRYVNISGNSAFWGGGIYSTGIISTPTLDHVRFIGNSANGGGGMYNFSSSSPKLTNGTFNGNSATGDGGALFNDSSSPTLASVTFNANKAGFGGGMYNQYSGSPTLKNVTFSLNKAASYGGGMYNFSTSPKLTNGTFHDNSATDGGGMYNTSSSNPKLTNVTFNSNSALTGFGGAIFNDSSSPTLASVTFNANKAAFGGGVYNQHSGSPTLRNVTFSLNKALYGGGMYTFDGAPTLTDVTFNGNSATTNGGGMYNQVSNPTLVNLTFQGNSATTDGGGIYNEHSDPNLLINVTFSGNSASGGGGIYNDISNPAIYDGIFWNDSSEIFDNSSAPTIADSLIAGGCPLGASCSGSIIMSNPLLGALANNGGITKTMALIGGSPAIDAGSDATCALTDQRGVHRPQGLHCDMGAYEAPVTKYFLSNGSQDGWILETGENTNVGGTLNSGGPTLTLGDDASRRQYRSILSFNTGSLPDNASIISIKLQLSRSSVTPPSTNPIALLQGIMLDVKKGFFGSNSGLQASDFQSSANNTVGPYFPTLSSGLYTITLNSSVFASVNKLATNGGLTQIRLRFKLDDNNNSIANTLNLFSGSNSTSANWPILFVVYTTP